MAITTDATAVTDTAAVIYEGTGTPPVRGERGADIIVCNLTGSDTVYLGGSDVTDANGVELGAGEKLPLGSLASGDDVWAVCATGESADVRVMVLPA